MDAYFFFLQHWFFLKFHIFIPWYLSEGARCKHGYVKPIFNFDSCVILACLIMDGVNVCRAKFETLCESDNYS